METKPRKVHPKRPDVIPVPRRTKKTGDALSKTILKNINDGSMKLKFESVLKTKMQKRSFRDWLRTLKGKPAEEREKALIDALAPEFDIGGKK